LEQRITTFAFAIGSKVNLLERFRSESHHSGIVDSKIAIEIVDDLIVEGEETAKILAGLEHQGSDHFERPFIQKVREQLRASAPDYVASFNDMVSSPIPPSPIPQIGRTMSEHQRWAADDERVAAWRVVAACVARLKEIRKKIRATLP
jgi:hypothetical protein